LQLWSVIFTDFALSEEEIVAPDETNGADW
jgi:hypothetical protein